MSIQSISFGTPVECAMAGRDLVGRAAEQTQVDQLLLNARTGQGAGVLTLRGDRGIGKTALLDCAARQAPGYRILRVRGVESERELPYAALQLICASVEDSLGRLQSPSREALETAIGLRTDAPLDRLLVGRGMLALLSKAAEARPLLCIVDDAQWLDRSSSHVLAFVARRLKVEPIVVLLAERESERSGEFDGLPELVLEQLSDAAARTLFGAVIPGRVDEAVLGRIVAETRGNPLALLELARAATPADFAGGFRTSAIRRLPDRTEQNLHAAVTALPPNSRRLLLIAAAEPIGDPTLYWRAAAHMGVPMEAAEPLEAEGIITLGSRVTFNHPQLRSVIYGRASREERRVVHRALAAAIDATIDSDRRVWHLAHAANAPDEEIAAELERCAAKAQERGGPAAAAAFLEKAALLTLDSGLRVDRALNAAAAKLDAGDPDAAARLVATAEMGPLDRSRSGRVQLQRARIRFASRRGSDAPRLLLIAARQLEACDSALARETYLEALAAAIFAGRLGSDGCLAEIAEAAGQASAPLRPGRPADLLLDGLVIRLTKGYEDAVEPLRQALAEFRSAAATAGESMRWLWLACRIAADVWDDETWHELTSLQLNQAREAGGSAILPYALTYRAIVDVNCGDFATAAALVEEADATAAAMGRPRLGYTSLVLAGWQGEEDRALRLFAQARQDACERGEGIALTTASLSAAVLYNGLGRYDEALAAASEAAEQDELGLCGWALAELIEAAARSSKADTAVRALERLSERTRRSATDWALGIEARSRALLSDGPAAESLYLEAIERLGRSRFKAHLARAQLAYGEWLRRQGRRLDARALLRTARDSFTVMGARAFAERAHLELLASGETARARVVDTHDHLTPQETRVALLARDGLTNQEIGERLFVSPRTVEYHLHKVFAKFGITSRTELHLVMANANGRIPQAAMSSAQRQIGQPSDESQCA